MKLRILLPARILIDTEVKKVVAEARNGSFGILPRHIDFVAATVPGILSFVTVDDKEKFVAVDRGIIVKAGPDVLVSIRNAALGPDLGVLKQTVEKEFLAFDDREKRVRSAAARLEADLVRKFTELK